MNTHGYWRQPRRRQSLPRDRLTRPIMQISNLMQRDPPSLKTLLSGRDAQSQFLPRVLNICLLYHFKKLTDGKGRYDF